VPDILEGLNELWESINAIPKPKKEFYLVADKYEDLLWQAIRQAGMDEHEIRAMGLINKTAVGYLIVGSDPRKVPPHYCINPLKEDPTEYPKLIGILD
jgi:hypothetical protein